MSTAKNIHNLVFFSLHIYNIFFKNPKMTSF